MGGIDEVDQGLLLKIALVSSIVGLASLFFYSKIIEPREAEIYEVEYLQPGSYVLISGEISDIEFKNGWTIIRVCNSGCINVHVNEREMNVFVIGENITVKGIVKEYYGRRYIDAIDVELIG